MGKYQAPSEWEDDAFIKSISQEHEIKHRDQVMDYCLSPLEAFPGNKKYDIILDDDVGRSK